MSQNNNPARKRAVLKTAEELEAEQHNQVYQSKVSKKNELLDKEFQKAIMQKSLDENSEEPSGVTVNLFV